MPKQKSPILNNNSAEIPSMQKPIKQRSNSLKNLPSISDSNKFMLFANHLFNESTRKELCELSFNQKELTKETRETRRNAVVDEQIILSLEKSNTM